MASESGDGSEDAPATRSSPRRAVRPPTALTIAGSDSGGGAGIQADLKAFARCGVHGTSAIVAVTAQNTLGVSAVHHLPTAIILAQVRAVVADIGADAVKVGMLGSARCARAVARVLKELPAQTPVVVDPVMVAESGAQLLDDDARRILIEAVLPRASVATPNLAEARALCGRRARRGGEAAEAEEASSLAFAVRDLGARAVVVTGGHRTRAIDVFLGAGVNAKPVEIAGERHPDGAAHGSGCTHSAILAAQLALGASPLQAARRARAMTGRAVRDGLRGIGRGAGPVDVIGLARGRSG
jgi:hydroxymethylpyrimidine/phosphomethylpyrimidine kinase